MPNNGQNWQNSIVSVKSSSKCFPKQLYNHLNLVTFLQEYFYEFCKSQQNQRYLKGHFRSWKWFVPETFLEGRTPRGGGSQQHKIGFLTHKTTHSAKSSVLKNAIEGEFVGSNFQKISKFSKNGLCGVL